MLTENKKTPAGIKIVIADDHPICLEGFSKLLGAVPDFEIIGHAKDGNELIAASLLLEPDVILTDIRMPELDGLEATKQISKQLPKTRIIGLSMLNDPSVITEMISAGAHGYLIKNASATEIIQAIKEVYEGGIYYCKDTTSQLVKSLMPAVHKRTKIKGPVFSDREISIIKLICEGLSHKEIAKKLFLSTRTIEWHKNQIMEKLDSKSSASIVVYALKNNICS